MSVINILLENYDQCMCIYMLRKTNLSYYIINVRARVILHRSQLFFVWYVVNYALIAFDVGGILRLLLLL